MRAKQLRCAYCGELRPYPGDFPASFYAQCTACMTAERDAETNVWWRRLLRALGFKV